MAKKPVSKTSIKKNNKINVSENSIVVPAVTPEQAVKTWENYQELKSKIIDKENDIQEIRGENFLKKSYWRKLATFFNLSTKVKEEKHEKLGNTYVWHFTVEAIAPNGRTALGVGSCDLFEKAVKFKDGKYFDKFNKPAKPNSIHNIRSTAETRATNRAISNLVGGGEVSAEEADQTQEVRNKTNYNTIKNSPKKITKETNKKTFSKKIIQEGENFIEFEDGKIIPKTNKRIEIAGFDWYFNQGIKDGKYWANFKNAEDKDQIYWAGSENFSELLEEFRKKIREENNIIDLDDIPDFM